MCRNNQPASKIGVTVNAVARERSDSLCGRELPHGECQGGHTPRDSWYPCRSGQHGDGFLQERNQGGLKLRKRDSQETQTWQGLMSKDHLTNSWDSLNPPLSKTCPDSSTENHNLLHSYLPRLLCFSLKPSPSWNVCFTSLLLASTRR